jgi:hypothetical protein
LEERPASAGSFSWFRRALSTSLTSTVVPAWLANG